MKVTIAIRKCWSFHQLRRKEGKCDNSTLWFKLCQKHIEAYPSMPGHMCAETEELLKEGCHHLLCEESNGIKINVKQTAFDLNVPYTTLWSCFLNIHKPTQETHASQQFLSPSQERLLIKWIEHLGLTGCPLCKQTIRIWAQHLHPDNKHPRKNWIYSFLKWHPNIVLSSASGLDPKRAKAFNRPVVNWYFNEFKELVESHGIPIENIYNMDKKGCQRSGGKKTSCRKYLLK